MTKLESVDEVATATRQLTPTSQAKHKSILVAAKAVFLEGGYQLASMDRIAEQAETTKRTVYDHFGNKESLFSSVVATACANVVSALPAPDELPADPREGLRHFAEAVGQLIGTVGCIRLQRMVIAEAERHPEFAAKLYDTALASADALLVNYLEKSIASGRMKKHNPHTVARMLVDVIIHAASLRGLLAVQDRPVERQETAEAVSGVIDLIDSAFSVRLP